MPSLASPTRATAPAGGAQIEESRAPRLSPVRAFFSYLRSAYSLDLRSLALFRIGLALVLLGDLLVRSFDLTAFYTDWGVLPRAALLDKFAPADRFSIHLMSGQPFFQWLLFGVAAIFAFMLLFGVKTRFAAVASWLMLVSLQNRNPEILQGGDVYLRQLAFWAMFLPIGALYSVDSALNTSSQQEASGRKKFSFFSVPGLALLIQVALVYIFAVVLKTGSAWHSEHSAVYLALNIQQMSTPIGHLLLHFPRLLPWLTRGTLFYEGLIPVLVLMPLFFGPVRTLAALLIIILHASLGLSIRLGHFPWIAGIATLALLPGWFWERALPKTWRDRVATAGSELRVYYDDIYPFCKKSACVLRTLLLIPRSELVAIRESVPVWNEMYDRHSWMAIAADGQRRFGFDGLLCVFSHSPLFSWIAQCCRPAWTQWVGDAVCRAMQSRREKLSELTVWFKFHARRPGTAWYVNVAAFFLILYIVLWNVTGITHIPFRPAQEKLAITLDLDQSWDMFAPYPLTYDGWYVIEGHLRDGSNVDVLHPSEPVSYEQPDSIADQYKNERWRKYLMNLSLPENTDYRLYYARSFCRSWNTGRSSYDQHALITFDIFFMAHQNSISKPPTGFTRDVLWHHECFK
ncbi:MAG: HTTM domain-containing protein [Acidobacteria bacterium]|nr:HTTM domain-containing protein [Acidobacteriota bacterium]MBV9435457.1 HTTM domain-containing protein [Acidobacteriota bacterium]